MPNDQQSEIIDTAIADAEARSEMQETRPEEYRAAKLLQSLLGGRFIPRDVGGQQGMHDFDLEFADGAVFAVEVTTDNSQTDMAFQSQIRRIDPLETPGMAHSWRVEIAPPGEDHTDQAAAGKRTKKLQDELPGLLSRVESENRFAEVRCVSRYCKPDEPEVVGKLRYLGVRSAICDERTSGEKQIFLGPAGLGGWVGPCALVDVVQEHVPLNSAKLVKAKNKHGAAEAHLFIWLTLGQKHRFGRGEILLSYEESSGPDDFDRVDMHGLDAVWVAVDAGPSHAPDCRHLYPILCHDNDGWHDWRMRRS